MVPIPAYERAATGVYIIIVSSGHKTSIATKPMLRINQHSSTNTTHFAVIVITTPLRQTSLSAIQKSQT